MELQKKLEVLADAAKYDASCASSGAPKRGSRGISGLGASTGAGICHSFTPDGRCVSLLKILLTNFCLYDCQYCVNRRSSNVPRARLTPEEVVDLTLDFYRRNYIDGLFLSSGIIRSSNYTMEQLVRVAQSLREDHQFRGYLHLKTIPDADPELIAKAGRYADRLSVNIELPTDGSLAHLAPEKNVRTIKLAMGSIRLAQEEAQAETKAPPFTPAGQSTQMIVGADQTNDRTILQTAESLYGSFKLKRVYYSAFSPIPDSPSALPAQAPPCCANIGFIKPTFCCAATASMRTNCSGTALIWRSTSIQSSPGRSLIANSFLSTSTARRFARSRACPASACVTQNASWSCGARVVSVTRIWCGCAVRWRRSGRSW